MTWEPVSSAELHVILSEQVSAFDSDVAGRWARYGIEPQHVPCIRDGSGEPEPIFVVARAGSEVLIYDDVEDRFGTGVLDSDGVLRRWGTYGERLAWSLRHFPESSQA